jgi:uncharacterized protein (TIGR02231 family)
MKRQFLGIGLVLLAVAASGQGEKSVESKITHVTVFLSKAQVTREARSHLEPGKTNLILTGLTAQLDPESIQVTGKGNFTILGITHEQNFLTEFNLPRSLRALKDSLEYFQRQVVLEESQKEILNKEETMLLSNQKIGGTNQNLTVAELKAMADFYRSRLGDIVLTRMKQDEKIKKINEHIGKLQLQINTQNELYSRNTSEITVSISADASTDVGLEINYIVANAAWNPVYDLRAINTKSPIQLSYKANVHQSTGEDWKNIRLKLSTANPNLSGLKPEVTPWYLSFEAPVTYYNYGKKNKAGMGAMMRSADASAPAAEIVVEKEAKSAADFVSTIQTSLNTEFDIALPYSVPSASKPTMVDIRNYEMKADYLYSVAPKLDADAFLLARAVGWEEYSLLPGEANIFFEGTFVGKTFIDPNNIKDTLSVSLGRDKRIVVKREKQKELSSRKLIGTNQKESYAWEISIRNGKTDGVRIIVEDQIPVSENSQIEVTMTDQGGAKYNPVTGKLIWELNLQPNENKKLGFKYEIKYPKGKTVSGLY